METEEIEKVAFVGWIFLGFLLIFIIKASFDTYKRFRRKRNYYKIEMGRAETPAEKERWEKRLHQLYFDLIPIFNKRNWYALKGFFHFLKKKLRKISGKDEEDHRHHHHHHHHHHHGEHHHEHHHEHQHGHTDPEHHSEHPAGEDDTHGEDKQDS